MTVSEAEINDRGRVSPGNTSTSINESTLLKNAAVAGSNLAYTITVEVIGLPPNTDVTLTLAGSRASNSDRFQTWTATGSSPVTGYNSNANPIEIIQMQGSTNFNGEFIIEVTEESSTNLAVFSGFEIQW